MKREEQSSLSDGEEGWKQGQKGDLELHFARSLFQLDHGKCCSGNGESVTVLEILTWILNKTFTITTAGTTDALPSRATFRCRETRLL